MKKTSTLIALLCIGLWAIGQNVSPLTVTFNYALDQSISTQIPPVEFGSFDTGINCYSSTYGTGDLDLGVELAVSASGLSKSVPNYLINSSGSNLASVANNLFDPTIGCSYDLINYQGVFSAYAANAFSNFAIVNEVSNTVDYDDRIQVYNGSSVAQIIELPLHLSAYLNAFQFFCNNAPDVSVAKAELTATVGDQTISLNAETTGLDSWSPSTPSENAVLKVTANPGVNIFTVDITGEVMVRVKTKGLSQTNVVACSATSLADVSNTIIVSNFTGVDGGELPENLTIYGLDSGINYNDPAQDIPCIAVTPPELMLVNDSCNLALGAASVDNVIDSLSYTWSNGTSGESTMMLPAGNHFLTVGAPSGCSIVFPFEIEDPTRPEITLPDFVQSEDSETVLLEATDGTDPGLSYLWSTGEETAAINVTEAGEYSVEISTAEGCTYSAAAEVSLLTTCFDPCSDCASFYFEGEWDSLALNLTGNSYLTDTSLVLHEAATGQRGACWYTANKQLLSLGFTSTFELRLSQGGGLGGGADGFAFVIQNSDPYQLGQAGGGIGYAGIENGIAIEFDTFANPGDINSNHIAVEQTDGNISYGSVAIADELIDGEIHQFRLHYDLDSLYVFFDDAVNPLITVGLSIYELIDDVDEGVWLGFTGSTGLGYQKTELFKWSFSTLCTSTCNDGIQNGSETGIDCGGDCSGCQCIGADAEPSITCFADGSYELSFDLDPLADGSEYSVYEVGNVFGELDTLYFTDDGTVTEISFGPYAYGRPYDIALSNLSQQTNCFTELQGTAPCTYDLDCNLSLEISGECINDSLFLSGIISGGVGPFSLSSELGSRLIQPNGDDTFSIAIPGCELDGVDFWLTDFAMCQASCTGYACNGNFFCVEEGAEAPNCNCPNGNLDADGICIEEDCDDNNANIGAIGDPCDDGNACTIDDVITETCNCEGTEGLAACMDVTACNFNPDAVCDDSDSCIYEETTICDDGICANGFETFNPETCSCDPGVPQEPLLCDDGDCSNGLEFYNELTCECEAGTIGTEACDDGICSNGIETYNPLTCECDPGEPVEPLQCDDGDCSNGIESYDEASCQCIPGIPISDETCDDLDCTTVDYFDSELCVCVHETLPLLDCNDNDCNTVDSYNTETCTCEYEAIEPLVCDDDCELTEDYYDTDICACVNVEPDPDDGCVYTIDSFNHYTCEIEHVGPLCNDGDCSTMDYFDYSICDCQNIPIEAPTCDDSNCATLDYYDFNSCECVHEQLETPICDDQNCLTIDNYDEASCQCVFEAIAPPICDDQNCLTIDIYDEASCQCVYEAIAPPICDDQNCLTTDIYDEVSCQCVYEAIAPPICDDQNCLTTDIYDEQNCQCVYEAIAPPICDDLNCLTTDIYDEQNCQCVYEAIAPPICDDQNCLTIDIYDEASCQCVYEAIAPPICDDQNCLTIDIYDEASCQCVYEAIAPPICDDQNCLTVDTYDESTCTCLHEATSELPDCDDNDCSTSDTFDNTSCNCIHTTLEEPDCDDGNCYTEDIYDSLTCSCVHNPQQPPNCDDGDVCTADDFNDETCDCDNIPIPECGIQSADIIGSRIWLDSNQNGAQDNLEPGIVGIPVTLRYADNTIVKTTYTDELGGYVFFNLDTGLYKLTAEAPDGYQWTLPAQAPDDIDNDFFQGRTNNFLVTLATGDLDFDGGLYPADCGEFASELTVICDEETGEYYVVLSATGASGGQYMITSSSGYNGVMSGSLTDGPFPNLLGYNYTISILNRPECNATYTTLLYDCVTTSIELLDFHGEVLAEGNQLYWSSLSEVDNAYYTLERSYDGQHFEAIGTIAGNGSSDQVHQYQFLDTEARAGLSYYRLKDTDFGGVTTMSSGIVSLLRDDRDINVGKPYPSPTSDQVFIGLELYNEEEVSVMIYDIVGRSHVDQRLVLPAGNHVLNHELPGFAPGMYIMVLTKGYDHHIRRFVVE